MTQQIPIQPEQARYNQGQDRISQQPPYPITDPSFLKARIDTSTLLTELKYRLEGFTQDEQGNWAKLGNQLMNREGVNNIISMINMYVNPNTLFAEVTRDDINDICFGLSFDLTATLVSHEDEWEIKDIPLIKRGIMDIIFLTLTRALGRGEAESIGRSVSIERLRIQSEDKESWWKLWKRGR